MRTVRSSGFATWAWMRVMQRSWLMVLGSVQARCPPPKRAAPRQPRATRSIAVVAFPDRLFPTLDHRLSPRDMALEAKRFRHVAVAIPEVRIGRNPVSLAEQGAQAQQPNVAYSQLFIGWRAR